MAKKRNSASRMAVWVILGLLIVGLMGFGATNFGGGVNSVASVGERELTVGRYVREMNQQLARFSQQAGFQITMPMAVSLGLDRQFMGNILANVAMENEAAALGVSADDARVRDAVLDVSAFQGVDGSFDREGYRFALQQAGLSETEFEEEIRHELARNIVARAAEAGTRMPEAYARTILTYLLETRDFTWAVLSPDDLAAPIPEPSDEDLRAYWESNEDAFMLPETRDISYAWLTPEMLAGTIEADDAMLEELYRSREAEYNLPERRLVERLVFPSQSAADEAIARIEAGDVTFDDLVAERDLTLADVDLGDVTEAELGAAGEAVFALDGPGVAGPVETDLGPALMRMNGILPAQVTTFEEARDELLGEFRSEEARREIGARLETIEDLLASGATLEELAAETAMEAGQIDWAEGATEGPAAYPEFREAALAAEVGDFPEVIEAGDGMIFALRLNEVVPPRVKPFEEARFEVETAWRRQTTVARLAEQAQAVADDLRAGAGPAADDDQTDADTPEVGPDAESAPEDTPAAPDADAEAPEATAPDTDDTPETATDADAPPPGDASAAEEDAPAAEDEAPAANDAPAAEDAAVAEDETAAEDAPATGDGPAAAELVAETGIGRDATIPDTPTGFVEEIFAMEPGEVRVIEGATSVYAVRLDAVTLPDTKDPEVAAQVEALTAQLSAQVANDVLAHFAAAIQAEAGITINQAALNAVHAQYGQ